MAAVGMGLFAKLCRDAVKVTLNSYGVLIAESSQCPSLRDTGFNGLAR
jgi:hypothetical protein